MDRHLHSHRPVREVGDRATHGTRRPAVSTAAPEPASSCLRALEAACALGRADGLLAVEVDLIEEPVAVGAWCHGLDPESLARHVWGAAAGAPPASVRLNAPSWYAQGFHDVLASARRSSRPAR